jgi:hypothetical protein
MIGAAGPSCFPRPRSDGLRREVDAVRVADAPVATGGAAGPEQRDLVRLPTPSQSSGRQLIVVPQH